MYGGCRQAVNRKNEPHADVASAMKRSNSRKAVVRSMRDKAYLYLQRRIRSGELVAGAALSEVSIARELGSSRTPVREAIRQLVVEGFLRQTANGVSAVVEFSKRDVAELYELREALEVYAVGKAAEHELRPPDLDSLRKLVSEILVLRARIEQPERRQLNAEQMQRLVRIDLNFHAMLVRAAANRRILKTFADTRVLLNIFALRRRGHDAAQLTEIHRHHTEILSAVIRKDSEAAMRALRDHIRISKQERLREYDEWELESAMGQALPGFPSNL